MACVLRSLIRWGRSGYTITSHSPFTRATAASANICISAFLIGPNREAHFCSRALKLREASPATDDDASGDEFSSDESGGGRRSKNDRKRDAKRAVRWGMELAAFSPHQIKRILRVAELDQQVFDSLMLVKRMGRDVREGKRRQFNFIGGLLREVEPDLMDGLIQATKDGDHCKFQFFSGTETQIFDNPEEEDMAQEIQEEDDEEDSKTSDVLSRWFDGLINKDVMITKEVYALQEVEFDRQKLRQLVRKVQSSLVLGEGSMDESRSQKVVALSARQSLTRFLEGIVKQLPPP